MARKIEDSFSQVLAVSRSSRKIRNIIAEVEDLTLKVEWYQRKMALSSKTLILIICGLEIIWYCYGMSISWFGIGNAYYPYFMAIAPEPSWSDIDHFCIGLIVYVLSTWSTLFLAFVALTDGEFACKFVKKKVVFNRPVSSSTLIIIKLQDSFRN